MEAIELQGFGFKWRNYAQGAGLRIQAGRSEKSWHMYQKDDDKDKYNNDDKDNYKDKHKDNDKNKHKDNDL